MSPKRGRPVLTRVFNVIEFDVTLVGAHRGDRPTHRHGLGFTQPMAFLDASGEPLAARPRPGNAEDHVIVLDDALAVESWQHTSGRGAPRRGSIARLGASGRSGAAAPTPPEARDRSRNDQIGGASPAMASRRCGPGRDHGDEHSRGRANPCFEHEVTQQPSV